MSHKNKTIQPAVTERMGTPRAQTDTKGNATLLCPFCIPPHALPPVGISACGTQIQVRAVQIVHKGRYNKKLVCVKCREGGGDMVQFNNAFIHIHDCMPGVATFIETPKFSRMASLIYKLPGRMKPYFEKYLGEAKAVEEVTADGTRTGTHLGYFFYKRSTQ